MDDKSAVSVGTVAPAPAPAAAASPAPGPKGGPFLPPTPFGHVWEIKRVPAMERWEASSQGSIN